MRIFLLFTLLTSLVSCSSSNKSGDMPDKIHALALPFKHKARVEVEGADGSLKAVRVPGSTSATYLDPLTGKRLKTEGWVDPTKYNQTPGSHLKKLSNDELFRKAKTCTSAEAVYIIDEVRARRKESGIKVLIAFLGDTRPAGFSTERQYWWYEKKNAPYQKIEVRTYAAFTLQVMLRLFPSQVRVFIDYNDKLLYAVRNEFKIIDGESINNRFAVVKDDLVKVWLQWWEKNKSKYL